MPILTPEDLKALEDLRALARDLADRHRDQRAENTLERAGAVLKELSSGRALERVLQPMIDELRGSADNLNDCRHEFREGGPREFVRGRIAGLEDGVNRIVRDNVVEVG